MSVSGILPTDMLPFARRILKVQYVLLFSHRLQTSSRVGDNSALALTNAAGTTDGSSFNKNFLDVGISNPSDERNKRTYFVISQDDQEGFTNVPPGLFKFGNSSAGVREVYRISQNLAMIKITEIHPVPGTQYFRTYNNGSWNTPGWKIITPE